MACNCIEEVENKVLARIKEIYPKYNIVDCDFENKIYCLGDQEGIILTHRFGYDYTFTKVNGTEIQQRHGNMSVNPTYCGFCGVKFIENNQE